MSFTEPGAVKKVDRKERGGHGVIASASCAASMPRVAGSMSMKHRVRPGGGDRLHSRTKWRDGHPSEPSGPAPDRDQGKAALKCFRAVANRPRTWGHTASSGKLFLELPRGRRLNRRKQPGATILSKTSWPATDTRVEPSTVDERNRRPATSAQDQKIGVSRRRTKRHAPALLPAVGEPAAPVVRTGALGLSLYSSEVSCPLR